MSLLTIVLMTHNRPVLAVNAIESILNQSEKDFKLVVSDNSSNKELQEIMEARFPQVEHKSWFPGMPLAEHFKKVISLVDTAYFVMFHDDDLMEPDYVKRILEEFKKEPHAAAIATNAWKIDKDGEKIQDSKFFVSKNKTFFMKIKKGDNVFTPPKELHATYFPVKTILLVSSKNPRDKKTYEQDTVREKLIDLNNYESIKKSAKKIK